jgi:CheY-like chemotaxis protein
MRVKRFYHGLIELGYRKSLNYNQLIEVIHLDDEPNVLTFTKMFLETMDPSIMVNSVNSYHELEEELEANNYDCIICDYKMPEINGLEVAKKIKTKRATPLILYTGQDNKVSREEAFASGVDDYIRKEIDPSHYHLLAESIRSLVEEGKPQTPGSSTEEYKELYVITPNPRLLS